MTVRISALKGLPGPLRRRLKETAEALLEAALEVRLSDSGEPKPASCGSGFGAEEATVGIEFVDDGEMRRLNRKFRHKDASTNVLSFPVEEFGADGEGGGIVISLDTALREAGAEENLEAWLTRLMAHGMLHLMGYDHYGEKQASWDCAEAALEAGLRSRGKKIPEDGISLS